MDAPYIGGPLWVTWMDAPYIGGPIWVTWMDAPYIGGPLLDNLDGRSFSRAFERQEKFLYFGGNFLLEILKMCKKGLCKRAAVFIGALLRKLEGVLLLSLLREKKKIHIWVHFSWTQRTLKVKSGSHLEFLQGKWLPGTDNRLWGTKGPFIRPRYIGTIKSRTQMLI